MNMNNTMRTLAAWGTLAASADLAIANPIAWGPATTISADSDVLTTGTSVFAYNWADSTQTVNGQAFTAPSTDVTLSSVFNQINKTVYTSNSNPFASLSSAYKSILRGSHYSTTANTVGTVTLNNLLAGESYAVQFWVNDPRGIAALRTVTLSTDGGNQATLALPINVAGQPGQFSVGLFDADATTQEFAVIGGAFPQVNALQVRNVTNIGTWVGTGGGTWDPATTANFASNLSTDPLVTTTFDIAEAVLDSVVFGDTYWNSGATVPVTQTAVTIAAGGVSAGSVRFANSLLDYTLSSSDANGLTGATTLVKGGSGTLTMSGTNSFTGGTGVGGGVLEFANGSLGSSGGIVVNGGTLRWASGNTENISSRLVMQSGGTATLDTNGNDVTFTSGVGSSSTSDLVKTGAGTLRLNAANTYAGPTAVTAGTLTLGANGSISTSSAISVASGATFDVSAVTGGFSLGSAQTLGGSGTVTGAVSLTSTGSILSPGASPGILSFDTAQTWDAFSYEWEVNDWTGTTAGTAFDQIAITGSLDLSSGTAYQLDLLSLDAGNASGQVPNFAETARSWTILTTTAGITGFDANLWTIDPSGFSSSPTATGTFSLATGNGGQDLLLTYAPVPEPAALGLLGVAGLCATGFGLARLRRRAGFPFGQ